MPDNNNQQHIANSDSHCPDCGVISGAFHTLKCGARDSGQEIWPGYCEVLPLALQIKELRGQLDRVLDRIAALEAANCSGETGTAKPRECPCGFAYEPSGECPGFWSGCTWHNEGPEPDDYDPGPECDDQGGMSEYRFTVIDGEQPS